MLGCTDILAVIWIRRGYNQWQSFLYGWYRQFFVLKKIVDLNQNPLAILTGNFTMVQTERS